MLTALWAVVRRDARISMSYRSMIVTRPVGVLFTLALFYFVSRLVAPSPRFPTPDAYFAFVAVGIVVQGIIRSSVNVPLAIRQEQLAGTYERLEASAAGGTVALLGMLLFPLGFALVIAAFTFVASAVVFGVDAHWSTAPLGIPIGILAGLAFTPFAMVFAATTVAFKEAPGQASALAAVSLVSGLYFPVELLPSSIQWLSEVQPFTPAVDLLRYVLVGDEPSEPALLLFARLVGFTIVGVPAGAFVVSFARRYSRHRGTLLES
jgi:ABC-2 type transport system permease protein